MTLTCLVEEEGRTRRFEEADFPLALGGPEDDVEIPGLAGEEPAAFLALHDGEVFAQPAAMCPCRSEAADHRLAVAPRRRRGAPPAHDIRVVWRADRKSLHVQHLPRARAEPPVLVVPAAYERPAEGDALVQPADYRRGRCPGHRPRRPAARSAAASTDRALTAGFVFAARAVECAWAGPGLSVRTAPSGWGGMRLLLPGDYTVWAQREGYRPLEARLAVTTDRNQVARFVLERLPGRVRVETHPADGVRFFVDGAERGTTPLAPLEIAAGDHEVSLRAEGFKVFTTRLNVAGGGAEQTLRATLVPDRAAVSFTSAPAEAQVHVDGADVGRTPLTALLSSGAREVTVSLAGHKPAGRTITVVAEQPLTVPLFHLEPCPAVCAWPAIRRGGGQRGR